MHGLSCSVAWETSWTRDQTWCSILAGRFLSDAPSVDVLTVFFSDGIINGNKLIYLKYVAKLESVGLSDGLNVMNDGNEEVMKMSRSVG